MSVTYPFGQPQRPYFEDFVYYNGLFNEQDIERIKEHWSTAKQVDATVSGSETYDDELRKTTLAFIPDEPENTWIYEKLGTLAIQTNHERYGFDILGFHYNLQLAKYGKGDFFEWHMDFGAAEISNRKLSITVQLSDPEDYEGGDLQFMRNHEVVTAPREKGTVVVFPSFVMHRVTPITKGERQSIVGWIAGPPYR